MIKFEPGMIVRHRLDDRKMILIASQVEIDCGEMHCRYFSEETGKYEEEYFRPEELKDAN